MSNPFLINGRNLGVTRLTRFALDLDQQFGLDAGGIENINASRQFVEQAIAQRKPVYGLTTGLGAKVNEFLGEDQLTAFSYQTLWGRAQAMGQPLPAEVTRGAMIIRINSMMTGASGGSLAIADYLCDCLNRGITPVVPQTGSIGASDLCLGATMGLSLIGEGEFEDRDGTLHASMALFESQMMLPLALGPKDGLVLANHSGFSASVSAFVVNKAQKLFAALQAAGAMTMEALSANLSPIDSSITELGQHPSHRRVADHLQQWLCESELQDFAKARKIQDPLSIRNIVQVHGALLSAITLARRTVNAEMNSVTDNPIVDLDNQTMISSGGYFSSELAFVMQSLRQPLDASMVASLTRCSKLMNPEFSGLPLFLAQPGSDSNGFAPTMKIAESLLSKIKHSIHPPENWPSVNANGVEDIFSNSYETAISLFESFDYCNSLVALELIMAAQALELSDRVAGAPAPIRHLYEEVRGISELLVNDRSIATDIDRLSNAIADNTLSILETPGQ